MGWFLCVATVFLAYGALEGRVAGPQETADRRPDAQALGLYAALFVEYVAYLVVTPSGVAVDAVGQNWNVRAFTRRSAWSRSSPWASWC